MEFEFYGSINHFVALFIFCKEIRNMGKGDKRTCRGKIFSKSYGKTRPRKMRQAAKAKAKAKA
jgi:ribosomal small subunit protein bTHX